MIDHNSTIIRYLDYPRLKEHPFRVVIIDSGYLTVGECRRGLEQLGHRVFTIRPGPDFIRRLLNLFVEVRPDFLMAVNHLGFDEEGKLTELLSDLKIPFASWYVDSPTYILYGGGVNRSPWCAVFCWEKEYLKPVEEMGFPSPTFLPLATDPEIFSPGRAPVNGRFSSPLAFVGDSMERARQKWEKRVPAEAARTIAALSCDPLLKERGGDILDLLDFAGKGGLVHRLRMDLEAALTWRTTQDYRLRLVEALMPLGLVIYGDPGWRSLIGEKGDIRPQVDYSRELPDVYRGTAVNVNCTSFQMKSAVNQRVFDVPACGGFVLSDHQEDMDAFFEVGKEAVCFSSIEEAVDLAGYYLERESERQRIAEAARRRVLSEHTYEKRMGRLVEEMMRRFA